MSSLFRSASECVHALKQITSNPALMRQEKHVYGDILSETTRFVPEMSPSEIRTLSKSVVIINKKFGLNLNNYLFKTINKQICSFLDSEPNPDTRHSLVSSMSNLSQVVRQQHDGGPPALRPDTVWRFAHASSWKKVWRSHDAAFDKAELLSVLGRLNIRPHANLVFVIENLDPDDEPNAIFFSHDDVTTISVNGDKSNGRIAGSLHSMAKLDMYHSPAFPSLLRLVPSRIDHFSSPELANILHATGTYMFLSETKASEEFSLEVSSAILARLARRARDLPTTVVNQVGLVFFANPEIADRHELQEFCQAAISFAANDRVNEIRQSKAQKVIRNALDLLGLADMVKEEYAVGPFRIDFAIPELELLIEINGPYHYYYKSMDLTTKTRLKHRVLEKAGFRIINVDHMEMKDEANRVTLMEAKIRERLELPKTNRTLRKDINAVIRAN